MVEQKPKPKPDLHDACILAGFVSLVAGIAWLSPPIALMIGGVMVLAYGLLGSARGGKGVN